MFGDWFSRLFGEDGARAPELNSSNSPAVIAALTSPGAFNALSNANTSGGVNQMKDYPTSDIPSAAPSTQPQQAAATPAAQPTSSTPPIRSAFNRPSSTQSSDWATVPSTPDQTQQPTSSAPQNPPSTSTQSLISPTPTGNGTLVTQDAAAQMSRDKPVDPKEFFYSRRAHNRVNPENLDPVFSARLYDAVTAAEKKTGERVQFNDLHRDHGSQARAYANYLNGGGLAAPPGRSRHNMDGIGRAADIKSGAVLSELHRTAPDYGLEFLTGNAFKADPVHIQLPRSAMVANAPPIEPRQTQMANSGGRNLVMFPGKDGRMPRDEDIQAFKQQNNYANTFVPKNYSDPRAEIEQYLKANPGAYDVAAYSQGAAIAPGALKGLPNPGSVYSLAPYSKNHPNGMPVYPPGVDHRVITDKSSGHIRGHRHHYGPHDEVIRALLQAKEARR